MKTTVSVSGISFIPNDKNGNPLNVYVLRLSNGKPNILRTTKQFLTDLKESGLIAYHVNNSNHPEVQNAIRDLKYKPFTITGSIKYCTKGEKWLVTENSRVVTDKSHPLFGQKTVGDEMFYENDMSIVEDAFLNISVHPEVFMINKQALATASIMASMFATPDVVESTTTGADVPPSADPNDIPQDVIDSALGATTEHTEPVEETAPATEQAETAQK